MDLRRRRKIGEEPSDGRLSGEGNGPQSKEEDTESSRDSLAGAGWACGKVSTFAGLVTFGSRPFSWMNLGPVWRSRNQILGDRLGDPTNDERREWMRMQREAGEGSKDLILRKHASLEEISFLVLGDPGEGDASQFAVVPPMLERGGEAHFMVICSDVIYPSGDADEYEDKFYRPYEDYSAPIYALPGNHDWYDGLHGFMFHVCGTDARGPGEPLALRNASWWKERVRRRLWRKPKKADPTQEARRKTWRSAPGQASKQRTPYFAIETGPVLLVGIDTGMRGDIDSEQGRWLVKISRDSRKPKVLLTGKPIYVDNEYHPCPIEGGGTVDEIVREPDHKYVAVIGGDVHNYQRYSAKLPGRDESVSITS